MNTAAAREAGCFHRSLDECTCRCEECGKFPEGKLALAWFGDKWRLVCQDCATVAVREFAEQVAS